MAKEMSTEQWEYEMLFDEKFHLVEDELLWLETDVKLEKGGWIFKSHLYSTKELLESPRIHRIYSISEKIGDDVRHWAANDSLGKVGYDVYGRKRSQVNKKLRAIQNKIEERKPYKWEIIVSIFDDASNVIMRLMPTVGKLLKLAIKLIDSELKTQKLLPKS